VIYHANSDIPQNRSTRQNSTTLSLPARGQSCWQGNAGARRHKVKRDMGAVGCLGKTGSTVLWNGMKLMEYSIKSRKLAYFFLVKWGDSRGVMAGLKLEKNNIGS